MGLKICLHWRLSSGSELSSYACYRLPVFPPLALFTCFPALSTDYMFSCALPPVTSFPALPSVTCFPAHCHRFQVFPRCHRLNVFPRIGTDYMFSRAWHRLQVFPRLRLVTCFSALATWCIFSHAWNWLLFFPRFVLVTFIPRFFLPLTLCFLFPGNGVTCTCRSGFTGDGVTCEGTIMQVQILVCDISEATVTLLFSPLCSDTTDLRFENAPQFSVVLTWMTDNSAQKTACSKTPTLSPILLPLFRSIDVFE